jgi:drug/metabolite transporter (DMT)-like permease
LLLVLSATLFLSLQNVFVKIAQSPKPLALFGGLLNLGGYVVPNPTNLFQAPLLVLLVRITFLVPILWLLLPRLKPDAIAEAGRIVYGRDRGLQLRIVLAGMFLLISQTCIYLAIAKLGPATAVTIFFIYPTVTTLLAWGLFGERPSWQQWFAIALIYLGCALASIQDSPCHLWSRISAGHCVVFDGRSRRAIGCGNVWNYVCPRGSYCSVLL